MKCPACKMETPEELGYCDFCKEPFRRKPPPPEPKSVEKVEVPAAVMAKILEAKRLAPGPQPAEPGGIPPEFAALDAGERIPELPPVARKLAWAFLAIIVVWAGVGLLLVMKRARQAPLPKPVMAPPPPSEDAGAAQGILYPRCSIPTPRRSSKRRSCLG